MSDNSSIGSIIQPPLAARSHKDSSATSAFAAATDTLSKAAAKAEVADESLWDLAAKGGWIMLPILLLSLIAVYFIIERFVAINKARKIEGGFMGNVKNFILSNNIDAAKELCRNSSAPEAKMMEKGLAQNKIFNIAHK